MTHQSEYAITHASEQIEELHENPPASPKLPPRVAAARDPLGHLDPATIWHDRADSLLIPGPDTGLDIDM